MEVIEKDSSALGGLFHQIITDMKVIIFVIINFFNICIIYFDFSMYINPL